MKLWFLLMLFAACCRLSVLVSDEPEVIGSHVPIKAAVGEDVILPCHLEPPFDVHNLTVEWRCNKTVVHMYRSLADDPDSQHPRFKNRTHLFHDEMSNGNISLKLFNVIEQDKGVYTCYVPRLHSQVRKGNITLEVVPKGNEKEIKGDPTSELGADENNLSPAAIRGIVIGVIAFVISILIAIVIKRQCRKQQENRNNAANPAELEVFEITANM